MEKQQSTHWSDYERNAGVIDGFPFNEGFPSGGPFGNVNKQYALVLRNGERASASVDYSTQYRTEGLRWRTSDGESLDKYVVAAWKEL